MGTTTSRHWLLIGALLAACHAPSAWAQPAASLADRLHENAMGSFRQARFSEAYGRLSALADAGHAPSARLALWMYLHGPAVFDKDWDCTQEQLSDWARLAGQPAPTQEARHYGRTIVAGGKAVRTLVR